MSYSPNSFKGGYYRGLCRAIKGDTRRLANGYIVRMERKWKGL